MYCPLCGSEYRRGFTICSDCQVALVSEPPRGASADPSTDGTSFALLWSGIDAHLHTAICEALERQKIPARTLGSEDHLFGLTTRPAFEVYVPADLVNSAREVIKQVAAIEEESEEPSESGLLEIPAEDSPSNGSADDYEERSDRGSFDPQDATIEIWSGENADIGAMIASSLRENKIPYRSDPEPWDPNFEESPEIARPDGAEPDTAGKNAADEIRATRLFVFPEDEKSAKEIVREIIDATPCE